MMGLDELRVAVQPGPGLACRFKGSALIVTDGGGITDQVEDLVEACRNAASDPEPLRALGQKEGMPSFCALVDGDDGILLLMSGVVAVNAIMTGRRMQFESTERSSWSEEKLRGTPITITIGKAAVKPTSHPLLDLQSGVVLGSALEIAPRGAPAPAPQAPPRARTARSAAPVADKPAPAPVEAPAPEPAMAAPPAAPAPPVVPAAPAAPAAPAGQTAPTDSSEGTVLMPPIPAVAEEQSVIASSAFSAELTRAELPGQQHGGPTCKNGHENAPGATTCWVCGIAVGAAADGARPVGRLVGAAGIDLPVKGNLIIGRRAAEAPEVTSGSAQAVSTPVDNQAVSRVHAEIRVDGANTLLIDRNSANGTFVMPPRTSEWIRLEPGHGVKIVPGTGIMIGPLELRFEAST